jgi:hypothetical protein
MMPSLPGLKELESSVHLTYLTLTGPIVQLAEHFRVSVELFLEEMGGEARKTGCSFESGEHLRARLGGKVTSCPYGPQAGRAVYV